MFGNHLGDFHISNTSKKRVPNYEGKACDAVVKLLEDRTGQKRTAVRRPQKDRIGPPVELRLRLGAQKYAIEHTRLETFPEQVRTDGNLDLPRQLKEPVIQCVCMRVGGGHGNATRFF